MTKIMIEFSAGYERHKRVLGGGRPEDFIMQRFQELCDALTAGRITGEQFDFASKLYRIFLENYGKPPTEAEAFALNLAELEVDADTRDAVVCAYRVQGKEFSV